MIRKRLIFLFLIQIVLVLFVSGSYLQFVLRDSLEQELAAKLESIAASISTSLDAGLIALLGPGDEESRTYRNLSLRLQQAQAAARLKRVVVMTPSGEIWVDATNRVPIGTPYIATGLEPEKLKTLAAMETISSPLFKGGDGAWYKTGYAPLIKDNQTIGIVAAEGSAESLQMVDAMQRKLYQIGLAALVFSLVLAVITANRLTRPLQRLQQAAREIGRGNLADPVPASGRDETAELARTMEEMRLAILKRDEQQKAMLAGVAHEIRNPLGGIELFAGLLKEELTDRAALERAEKILKETKNLQVLVQNFLEFGKPVVPKKEKCRLRLCWQEVAALLENRLENIEVNSQNDVTLMADPQHVKQILMNLTLNAVHSMNSGGSITISVSAKGKIAEIDFVDSGEGIPPEIQPKIFEPFFSNRESGMGLGLAMSRKLARENGGDLWLEKSRPGETVFKLRMPSA